MPGYAVRRAELKGSELLKAWLERSTMTQTEAAAYLGFSGAVFSQWLSGVRSPSLDVAFEIEDKTGVPARSWTLR